MITERAEQVVRDVRQRVPVGTSCRWLMPAAEMAGLVNGGRPSREPPHPGWARLPRIGTRTLAADAGSVRAARDFTVATLRRWGAAERSGDIAIVVSELLTNALRHALPVARGTVPRRPIRLGLLQHGTWLLCAVADPSRAVPVPQTPGILAETGRGLQMIGALSDQWGYTTPGDAGKVVWAMFYPRRAVPAASLDRSSAVTTALLHYCSSGPGYRMAGMCCDNAWMAGLSLALANLKPGTGKTTSAVWLAHVFAQAGNRVLLVDADPSGSALEWSDLAAMDPRLAAGQAGFPFRIVALPSRELHRRVPEIAAADDVVIIDTPQLEDHASIARSALRYADEVLIPCAPSPIEINRTAPVREEIAEVAGARGRPVRSAVLLNRCLLRAHSTADAREALAGLGYDVLQAVVPRREVYAQSFGAPINQAGCGVWRQVARELIARCAPVCQVRT